MESEKNSRVIKGVELQAMVDRRGHGWEAVKDHHLEKKYTFPDFATALAFTNKVGAVAEAEGHHPDIHLSWGKVRIVTWTHDAGGITGKDFALAEKVEKL